MPEKTQEDLSPGEIACGVGFNPSGDERVRTLKNLFASAFDTVEQAVPADDGTVETSRKRKMRDEALGAIITAQMWAVKIVTLK